MDLAWWHFCMPQNWHQQSIAELLHDNIGESDMVAENAPCVIATKYT